MKICVMGAGGLGGFFGGFLAAAGEDVSFVARGAHLDAIRRNGLTVASGLGDRHVADAKATDNPAEIGPVDIVLFCVKNYDLDAAAEACRPLLKPDTAVISLLNGVDAPERIAALLGPGHAVGGVTFVPANIAEPGVIVHNGEANAMTIGEPDGAASPRLAAFAEACRNAGLAVEISPDITTTLWTKFVPWSALAGVTAACRGTVGVINATPPLAALFREVSTETLKVGQAKGLALPDDLPERMTAMLASLPPETRNSMQVDLSLGKRLELETASGTVVRLGERLGVPTPANRALYAILLPFRDG